MGSRDRAKGEQAVADIVKSIGGDCKDRLELIVLDTSSDDSVKQAAASFQGSTTNGGQLYGIINNAGVGTLSPSRRGCGHV
jgi:NAD(P)-dependent dehydrogenase (short-subunit alcohol dehydrogenase family)